MVGFVGFEVFFELLQFFRIVFNAFQQPFLLFSVLLDLLLKALSRFHHPLVFFLGVFEATLGGAHFLSKLAFLSKVF